MEQVTGTATDQIISLQLSGHIDSNNAAEVEEEIGKIISGHSGQPVRVDADKLEYISSAGLRVLLKIRKKHPDIDIINVNPDVYEILDMTGFTQMMNVVKAYRVVSTEGCEVIGQGANGTIYRIDRDNVVKVYNNADALEEIQNEREVAKLALILGIPTAISYDVVRVGDSYGSVFELLDASSFSKILANEPEKLDWCVEEYVKLLKKIHSTVVPEGELPDMRETAISWANFMQDYLPEEAGKKLKDLIEAVPKDDHMIHGDYHTKNLELTGDEVLLIDMDTLAVGHPIFEFASIYNAFIGFSEMDHSVIKDFQGFDFEVASEFWNKVLRAYMGTDDPAVIEDLEKKARVVGYTRLIRRLIRRQGLESQEGIAQIEWWKKELLELLEEVDSLVFESPSLDQKRDCKQFCLEVKATRSELPRVIDFIEETLQAEGCPMKEQMQINIAVEEIFVNIASYAYKSGTGDARIDVEMYEDPDTVHIIFTDSGIPYNPLAKEDPDTGLPAEDRQIGGLGIFMVKQSMDDMKYEYRNGQNILTLIKVIQGGLDEQ